MYCSYHPINAATVQCSNCGRALCPACDHRIKGYALCQDCIVKGVERLTQPPPRTEQRPVSMPLYRARPRRAALFALLPGLGAVYNRQNSKALVHFLAVVGLGEMGGVTNLAIFGMGSAVFWLYSILDAYRTAESIQMGVDVSADEERLRESFRQHSRTWGLILTLMGLVFLLANFNPFHFQFDARRVWPVLLIVVGCVFLQDYFRHRGGANSDLASPKQPRSVVTASLSTLPAYVSQPGERAPVEERRN